MFQVQIVLIQYASFFPWRFVTHNLQYRPWMILLFRHNPLKSALLWRVECICTLLLHKGFVLKIVAVFLSLCLDRCCGPTQGWLFSLMVMLLQNTLLLFCGCSLSQMLFYLFCSLTYFVLCCCSSCPTVSFLWLILVTVTQCRLLFVLFYLWVLSKHCSPPHSCHM